VELGCEPVDRALGLRVGQRPRLTVRERTSVRRVGERQSLRTPTQVAAKNLVERASIGAA
jgi:hypothetical protein